MQTRQSAPFIPPAPPHIHDFDQTRPAAILIGKFGGHLLSSNLLDPLAKLVGLGILVSASAPLLRHVSIDTYEFLVLCAILAAVQTKLLLDHVDT